MTRWVLSSEVDGESFLVLAESGAAGPIVPGAT